MAIRKIAEDYPEMVDTDGRGLVVDVPDVEVVVAHAFSLDPLRCVAQRRRVLEASEVDLKRGLRGWFVEAGEGLSRSAPFEPGQGHELGRVGLFVKVRSFDETFRIATAKLVPNHACS